MNTITPKPETKTYTGKAAQILKLIGRGNCNYIQAAKAVGCDESYVSQLMKEEDFQIQVAQMIQEAVETATVIDANYDKVEKLLSERLLNAANMMFGPDNILRTLKFVNEAKKRTAPVNGGAGVGGVNGSGVSVHVVPLILPAVHRHEYTINPNGEVLQVDGMDLVTLDSGQMQEFSKKHKELPKPAPVGDTKMRNLPNVSRSQDYWSDL